MATTLQQIEDPPAAWPDPPPGLSAAAAALDPAAIWLRIEMFVAYRWAEREVRWTVEGVGLWQPPLYPAGTMTAKRWTGEAWADVTLPPSPYGGFDLPDAGPYQVEATVGAGPVPPDALEAFRRLAEYFAGSVADQPGATSLKIMIPDVGSWEYQMSASHAGKALQNSGAADLLRAYRRAP